MRSMSYIMTNKDRLSLIALMKIANDVTFTGTELHDILDRNWMVMAMKDEEEGFVGQGSTLSEAVAEWFTKANLPIPFDNASSLYELKEEYNGT